MGAVLMEGLVYVYSALKTNTDTGTKRWTAQVKLEREHPKGMGGWIIVWRVCSGVVGSPTLCLQGYCVDSQVYLICTAH